MACRVTGLVLDCREPERLAAFWCEVLGFVELGREDDDIEIGPPEGAGGVQFTLVLSRSQQLTNDKMRLHFDVNASDRDQAAELERLLAAGARFADVGQSGDEPWHVLADPEGNEFCLLRARVS